MGATTRAIKLLIVSMGGEGGGVLSDWLTSVGEAAGFEVRYTYIPGVAQRTGATNYYLEMFAPTDANDNNQIISALMPCPGDVDLLLATEIVEAGRALQRGFVTRPRTTVIASTHRAYTVVEKSAQGDGRADPEPIIAALDNAAATCHRFDMAAVAKSTGSVINAVMLGAAAGSGVLPMARELFEAAITKSGIAVQSNLAGFAVGFEIAAGSKKIVPVQADNTAAARPKSLAAVIGRLENEFASSLHETLRLGVEKLTTYQDAAYAEQYLARVRRVVAVDGDPLRGLALSQEAARWLVRLMAYDDVIRVAGLKTRASRFARARDQMMVKDSQIMQVTDFMKPSAEEISSVLPASLGRALLRLSNRTGFMAKGIAIKVATTSILGFGLMRVFAAMKPLRRRSLRYADEQRMIDRWLDSLCAASARDYALAFEIAGLARLIKGYADTHCKGAKSFRAILDQVEGAAVAEDVARLRDAALLGRL